jgi:hypothetical protein
VGIHSHFLFFRRTDLLPSAELLEAFSNSVGGAGDRGVSCFWVS